MFEVLAVHDGDKALVRVGFLGERKKDSVVLCKSHECKRVGGRKQTAACTFGDANKRNENKNMC